MPVWQNAFVLGRMSVYPNAEAALTKRPAESGAVQPAAPHAGLSANAPEAPFQLPQWLRLQRRRWPMCRVPNHASPSR